MRPPIGDGVTLLSVSALRWLWHRARAARHAGVIASAVLLHACGDSREEPAPLTCEEGDLELSEELGRRVIGTACSAHADCMHVSLAPHCPDDGARYTWCPYAAHVDDVARLRSELTSVLADVCVRIPADCRGGASCAETVPACVDRQCRSVDPPAPDAG